MPEFRTTRRVAHSAEEMFDLVADVERYPEFVPFCERLTVRGRKSEGGREMLVADMTIGYKLVRETFTSKVTLDREALEDPRRLSRRPVPHRWRIAGRSGRSTTAARRSASPSPTSSRAARSRS